MGGYVPTRACQYVGHVDACVRVCVWVYVCVSMYGGGDLTNGPYLIQASPVFIVPAKLSNTNAPGSQYCLRSSMIYV